MDVTQIYVFQGARQMNTFLKDNAAYIDLERIEIQLVPSQPAFFFFVIAEVRVSVCDEVWARYESVVA